MKLQLPVVFNRISDRKDRSCTMTFETRELTNEEVGFLRDHRDTEGWLLYAKNELQEKDIPKETAEVNVKTPSMRLRNIIFVYWKQQREHEQTTLDSDQFYKAEMEKLIQLYKNKLNRESP